MRDVLTVSKDAVRRLISMFVRMFARGAPRACATSTRDWAEQWSHKNQRSGGQAVEAASFAVTPSETKLIADAELIGATPDDIALACDVQKMRVLRRPETSIHLLPGAFVHGLDGAVVTADHELLYDLSPSDVIPSDHSIFRRIRFPRPSSLGGFSTSLVQPMSANYFHWMLECLPVLGLISRGGLTIDQVIIRGEPTQLQVATLLHLGYGTDRIVKEPIDGIIACERLVQPTFQNAWMTPGWVPGWLRSVFLTGAAVERRRIYVSRSDASTRRIANEEEIMQALTEYGFQRVHLTGMSVTEQATLFDAAEAVVAPHGAGLANIAFCRPGAAVIELFPDGWTPLCFFRLAHECGLRYRYATSGPMNLSPCERTERRSFIPVDARAHEDEFRIQPEKILAALRSLAISSIP